MSIQYISISVDKVSLLPLFSIWIIFVLGTNKYVCIQYPLGSIIFIFCLYTIWKTIRGDWPWINWYSQSGIKKVSNITPVKKIVHFSGILLWFGVGGWMSAYDNVICIDGSIYALLSCSKRIPGGRRVCIDTEMMSCCGRFECRFPDGGLRHPSTSIIRYTLWYMQFHWT